MSQADQPVGTDVSRPPDISSPSPSPKRPLSLGAGAVVVDNERVLLVRNKYGVTKGRYLLPAGRVNVGELPDRAAARETFEETNLRVAIEGLLGIRIWVMDNGEHNYFFMFRARLLSSPDELRPNLDEVDDARFFSKEEMDALTMDETWAGAIAVAYKALDPDAIAWPNDAELSSDSGVGTPDRWRIWL
ncbi:MAG: NUDIX domain-containing protein [Ktedonobacteraceae bacterium]